MNEQTMQQVLERIDKLAQKLGTTGEYLWGVMVRQAPISSMTLTLILVVWVIVQVWSHRWLCKQTGTNCEWGDEVVFSSWLAWVVMLIGLVAVGVTSMTRIVTGFLNPEFWALQQILR